MSQDENVQPQDTNVDVEEQKTDVEEQPKEVTPESGEPKEEAKPAERPVHTVPLSKFNEEREKAAKKAREEALQEAEAEKQRLIDEYEAKLNANKSTNGVEDKISKWAEEQGYDIDAAKGLVDVIKSSIEIPDTSRYDELLKERELQEARKQVEMEFETNVVPLITKDFPQATPEHIRKVKERVEELAFTEGYNSYRLEDIYQVKKGEFEFKNGYSAEPSGGRSSEMVAFEVLSDEAEIELAEKDPNTYANYLTWLRNQSGKFAD